MAYREQVQEEIAVTPDRVDERQNLWQEISDAFETGGGEQVAVELREKMADVQKSFPKTLGDLEAML